ncbi:MAG: DUF4124 domain-containing protein [Burkholderiales bacterium]
MKALIFSLLVLASCWVRAEIIYKSVGPEGGVIYSDEPIPGAKIVESYEVSAPGPRGPIGAQGDANEVARAERVLAEAERALQLGRDPLPGERKGIGGGGSRLTEDYFHRVLALERAVEKAQKRLQQAITGAAQ